MWKTKYGEFNSTQVSDTKRLMRKQIFFLLLCVDPEKRDEYENVDVNKAFDNVLLKFGGLNEILFCPVELVTILSLLEAARLEYNNPDFKFEIYRKLVLDAGNEVNKIKEDE